MPKVRPLNSPYSVDFSCPIQQGDIFLSGVVRLCSAASPFTPKAWAPFSSVSNAFINGIVDVGGQSLVMVVSHDCQIDKEFNQHAKRLMLAGMSEQEAYDTASQNPDLDRHILVSPLVSPTVLAAEKLLSEELLKAGKLVGYLPLVANDSLKLPCSVVDLSYRTCTDRSLLVGRLASLTEEVRIILRYALAKMDSLRSPALVFEELENLVGKKILKVRKSKDGAGFDFDLEGDETLHFLSPPGDTDKSGHSRAAPL